VTERAAVRGFRPGRTRIVAVVAMGALALGGLSACRTDAGSAGFVGNSRITDSHLESIASGAGTPAAVPKSAVEGAALQNIIYNDVAARYAKEHGVKTPAVTSAQLTAVAQEFGSKLTSEFTKIAAQADAWNVALTGDTKAVTPTDAELMAIYQRAVTANVAPPNQFAATKPEILAVPDLGQAVGLQRALDAAVRRYNVSINPRFQPACASTPCDEFSIPVLQLENQSGAVFNAVVLPLDPAGAEPPVLDQPTPAPSTSAAAGS
jgi:hypothetical protein